MSTIANSDICLASADSAGRTPKRISQIITSWSMIRRAHKEGDSQARSAQRDLLNRYSDAIRRYLFASIRDADAVGDVFQDFAYRFLSGQFHMAAPDKGRFRSFLKTTLYRMIVDYHRQKRRNTALSLDENAADIEEACEEFPFQDSWRASLLKAAWDQLQLHEQTTGIPFYSVLNLRREYPDAHTYDLVPILAERLGRDVTYGNLRQILRRARLQFAQLLMAEIMPSLPDASKDCLEEELASLKLLEYCRPAFESFEIGSENKD